MSRNLLEITWYFIVPEVCLRRLGRRWPNASYCSIYNVQWRVSYNSWFESYLCWRKLGGALNVSVIAMTPKNCFIPQEMWCNLFIFIFRLQLRNTITFISKVCINLNIFINICLAALTTYRRYYLVCACDSDVPDLVQLVGIPCRMLCCNFRRLAILYLAFLVWYEVKYVMFYLRQIDYDLSACKGYHSVAFKICGALGNHICIIRVAFLNLWQEVAYAKAIIYLTFRWLRMVEAFGGKFPEAM